jgi:hypothetical protein
LLSWLAEQRSSEQYPFRECACSGRVDARVERDTELQSSAIHMYAWSGKTLLHLRRAPVLLGVEFFGGCSCQVLQVFAGADTRRLPCILIELFRVTGVGRLLRAPCPALFSCTPSCPFPSAISNPPGHPLAALHSFRFHSLPPATVHLHVFPFLCLSAVLP